MTSYAVATLAIVLLVQASRAHRTGSGFAEEVLDKNDFNNGRQFFNYPRIDANTPAHYRRNSKSMSFVDYFFPPSRQAKVSNNFKTPKQISEAGSTIQSDNIKNDVLTNATTDSSTDYAETSPPTEESSSFTIEEGRATGSSKKGTTTSGKRKSSSRVTTATPKTKNSQKVSSQSTQTSSSSHSTKLTQKATTTRPVTKPASDTTFGSTKTTHKHYTIHPSIVMTKTNPPTSLYKTKQPESTTSKISSSVSSSQSTPVLDQKATLAELAKVSESVTGDTSPGSESTTEINAREGELDLREKPEKHHVKISGASKNETVPLPDGSASVLAKPTKYHYYPHNQHIYLLPECAIQQVCNAVYVRLNYTQPLCACPARHRDPCSASLNADDLHTTQLSTDSKKKYANRAITLVKTCEATSEMRECRAPRDWSLLALQNIRTGKSHYLVICRCPEEFVLEGPMSHDQPTYASVPGIRVYGMMCVQSPQSQYTSQGYSSVTSRPATSSYKVGYSQPHYNQDAYTRYPDYIGPGVYYNRMARKIRETENRQINNDSPPFPWEKAKELALTANWEN